MSSCIQKSTKENKKDEKNYLHFEKRYAIIPRVVTMIALKREVAAVKIPQVFRGANVKFKNWRQVTVLKLTITEKEHNCVREPETHQALMENNPECS